MKKIKTGILAFAILVVGQSFAQDDLREKFAIGVRAGVNVSNIWDTEAEDFDAQSKVGFAGGVSFAIPLGKFFAIQPEVFFSQKGFKATGSFATIPYEMKRTTNYLDIPILLSIRPFKFLSINVGPQIAFQLSQNNKLTIGNISSEDKEKFENNNWRKNMLGAHLGLDLNFGHFTVSPRVALDFQNNNGDGTSSDPRYKNFVFQLTAGWRF